MSLQSFGFFGFLLVVAAVYLHLPQRWQNPFLLAASWVFYALAMPSMLPVTIAIAVFTYLCGRGMTAREGARKTAFLRIGVVGLLAILAFFKYNGAFASDGGWQAIAMRLLHTYCKGVKAVTGKKQDADGHTVYCIQGIYSKPLKASLWDEVREHIIKTRDYQKMNRVLGYTPDAVTDLDLLRYVLDKAAAVLPDELIRKWYAEMDIEEF